MRQQVTTTDQDTAEVGEEPLITLKTFRSGAALGWHPEKWSDEVFFGWNLVADGYDKPTPQQPTSQPQHVIQLGDRLQVLSTRKGPFHVA